MLCKTKGIFLSKIKYSETSLILKIYTQHYGMLSFMVKGARSPKNKGKYQTLQHLALIDISFYYKENANLHTIKEWQFSVIFETIPFDIQKSTIVQFLNEVIQKSIVEEEKNNEMFLFIWEAIKKLDSQNELIYNYHLNFLLKFTRYLGFYPQGRFSEKNKFFDLMEGKFISYTPFHQFYLQGNIVKYLSALKYSDFEQTQNDIAKISNKERKELLSAILSYYKHHLPGLSNIKSLPILQLVF